MTTSFNRERFLEEANRLFMGNQPIEYTLETIVHLAVTYLADWAMVDLLEADQKVHRKAIAHTDPTKPTFAKEFSQYTPDLNNAFGIGKVIRTREPELLPVVPDDFVDKIAVDDRHAQLLKKLEIKSLIIYPLVSRGQILGTISFVSSNPAHRYDREDLTLARDMAQKFALALDNAQLYQKLEALLHEKTENLALLETLITKAPIGIAFLDKELRYLMINEVLAEINGISVEMHLGRSVRELLPDIAHTLEPIFLKILATGEPVLDLEVAGITPAKPSELRHWQASYYPVRTSVAEIVGLGLMVVEVTERKQNEEQLQRANRALRVRSQLSRVHVSATTELALLQNSCEVLVTTGGYRLAWAGFAELETFEKRIFPVAHSGIEKNYLESLELTWSDTSRGRGPIGTVLRSGKPLALRHMLTDPEFAPWRSHALKQGYQSSLILPLVENNQPMGVLCIYSTEPDAFEGEEFELLVELADDLSYGISAIRTKAEHQQAELDLLRSEERFRLLVENVQDYAIIIMDTVGRVVSWNVGAERLKGYKAEEILGKSFECFFIEADIARDKPTKILSHAAALGHYEEENWQVRKDRSRFYASVVVTALKDAEGNLLGFSKITQDITEKRQAFELLEKKVAERTVELATLLEISKIFTSTLDLKQLASLVLDALKPLFDYTSAAFFVYADKDLQLLDQRIPFSITPELQEGRKTVIESEYVRDSLNLIEPQIVQDYLENNRERDYLQQWMGEQLATNFSYLRAGLVIPLRIKERPIGLLSMSHLQPGYFTQRHLAIGQSIANHIAIALENAQLYEQAQKAAVLEERQRLARDLHDSVTQLLYGISLSTNTARAHFKSGKTVPLGEQIEEILSLTKSGLTEMRALLFELRPESLANEGLVAALSKQIAVVQVRHSLKVQIEFASEPAVSLAVKEVFYRVALEALNNIVKHAHASRIKIKLEVQERQLKLTIADDGKGFIPQSSYPGHLGITGMQERAAKINATLKIESTLANGTCLLLSYPLD